MEWNKASLIFVVPFLIQTGLGPLLPLTSGCAGLIPLFLSLGTLGILAHRFPVQTPRPRLTAFLWGILGAGLWVGICALDLERRYFPEVVSLLGARSPFPQAAGMCQWTGKLLSLLVAAPFLEELFFRGFLQTALGELPWWRVPTTRWRPVPLLLTALLFAGLHGGEWFAAFLWFYWVSFFLIRTKSFWDAVLIHAGTNLGLFGLIFALKGAGWDLSRLL